MDIYYNMRLYKNIILIIISILVLHGCGTIVSRNETGSLTKINKKLNTITSVEKKVHQNETNKFNLISSFSYGIKYSLDNINTEDDYESAVYTSKLLNNRILSISGYPNINDIKSMEELVDKLKSDMLTQQAEGIAKLEQKDKEIMSLINEKELLIKELEKANNNLSDTALKISSENDKNKVVINEINSYYGLGAVYYGFKRFLTTCFVTILCVIIGYVVLRILATLNPIASAIFSVIESVFSYGIRFIKLLAPNSTKISGLSSTIEVNKYKNTLSKVVDSIQVSVQNKEECDVTLCDIKTELSKNMNSDDKIVINEIKNELKW